MDNRNLGFCLIYGCCEPATTIVTPDIQYCDRHQASNIATTVALQSQQTNGLIRASIETAKSNGMIERCVILGPGAASVDGDTDWDIAVGTQYDPAIVAIRSRRYRETTYGDVLFVQPNHGRYEELLASAIQVK